MGVSFVFSQYDRKILADLKDSLHTVGTVINHTGHEEQTSLLYKVTLLLQGKPDKNQDLFGKISSLGRSRTLDI